MDDRQEVHGAQEQQIKKAYESPRLEVYGRVSEIAATGGSTVTADTAGFKKTA